MPSGLPARQESHTDFQLSQSGSGPQVVLIEMNSPGEIHSMQILRTQPKRDCLLPHLLVYFWVGSLVLVFLIWPEALKNIRHITITRTLMAEQW